MANQEPIGYDESPFPSWASTLNSWPWQPNKSSNGTITGWWKQGKCPRCGDPTPIEIGLIQAVDVITTDQVYARCECKVKHADGQTGCGAAGLVDGPTGE